MSRTKSKTVDKPTTVAAILDEPAAVAEPAPAFITPPIGFTQDNVEVQTRPGQSPDRLAEVLGTNKGYVSKDIFDDGRFRDQYKRRHVFSRRYFGVNVLIDTPSPGDRVAYEMVEDKIPQIKAWNQAHPEEQYGYVAFYPDTMLTSDMVRRVLNHEVLDAPKYIPPDTMAYVRTR